MPAVFNVKVMAVVQFLSSQGGDCCQVKVVTVVKSRRQESHYITPQARVEFAFELVWLFAIFPEY